MSLKPIAEGVWGHEQDLKLPLGMRLPSRATLMQLGRSGELVLHSPLAIDDDVAREIESHGDVRYIVAPSCIHWLFLAKAAARWPKAKVLGAPGLVKKVGSLAFDPLPREGEVLGGDLLIREIEGVPYIGEHVFLHQPSRTLVVVDLMFNVKSCTNFGMRVFLKMVNAYGRPAQSRAWKFFTRDRARAGQCVSTVLGWDYERIVVAHGDVIECDAREQARQALRWITSGTPPMLNASLA